MVLFRCLESCCFSPRVIRGQAGCLCAAIITLVVFASSVQLCLGTTRTSATEPNWICVNGQLPAQVQIPVLGTSTTPYDAEATSASAR